MAGGPEDGLEKSAMLLLSLGADAASEVLKHLGPREVQKLGHAMAGIRSVPRDKVEVLIGELHEHTAKGSPLSADEDMIRSMLTKALGDDKAANLIGRIL